MKNPDFKKVYGQLIAAFPAQYTTESMEDLWSNKFGSRDLDIFKKMIDILTEKDKFPSMAYAQAIYKRLANKGNQDGYFSNKYVIPDHVKKMTDEQIDADYEKMTGFMEAYPFPDYPEGASSKECQKVDDGYYKLMRTAGLDPNELTNPKVSQRLMRDIRMGERDA